MTAYQKRVDKCFKSGKCRSCAKPRDPKSKTFCTDHLEKHRLYSNKSVKKSRAKIKVQIKISAPKHKPHPADDHPFKQHTFKKFSPEERRRYLEYLRDVQDKEYNLVYNEYEGF